MGRIRSIKVVAAAMSAALVAQSALADPGRPPGWERDRGGGYYSDTDYARVVDVQPIVRRIRVSEPRRECYQETRYEQPRYQPQRYGGESPAAGSMILGGILGAAVGNQFGRGDGRRAATVAGAVIGSALGHDAAARRDNRYGRYDDPRTYEPARAYTVERCDLRQRESWEERVEGYRVAYEYLGRRYETRMPYDPGERVRVRVDVFPDE
ncbi:MAG: glycine zipper 2TM domain-containing protein [Steroidobacteraceae bacterium]